MSKLRPSLGILLAILFVTLCCSPQVRTILTLPANQRMVVGEASFIDINLPGGLDNKIQLKIGGPARSVFSSLEDPTLAINRSTGGYEILALKPGRADVKINLWGYIPLKSIAVEALAPQRVVVGGHSIGVFLQSNGIMVVGYAPVMDGQGDKLYPAREQGIEIGDSILKMDGQLITDDAELATAIDGKGNMGGVLTIVRRGKEMTIPVEGILCQETGRYRIGLYVRDGVVGVGTLTCWDPDSHRYAALGHIIVDADTHQGIDVLQGRVVSASVETVKPGKPGLPGEKIGVFNEKGRVNGSIERNSAYGIFGKIDEKLVNPLSPYEMEVAYAHQVKQGPAEIWTVVNGEDIEKFGIEIEKVFAPRQNGKDMIIRVTDPRLLSLTGGIIQGMSGSPIIQEGRLVGAVTHVFLNDPATGYGIYMDNILNEMHNSNISAKKVSTLFSLPVWMGEAL